MKEKQGKITVPSSVLRAVVSQDKVDAPPHNFYKYPARFSPTFAREVILGFTRQGDTVIDPFCGGGTSLVEAISLGRRAVGFDISSLAAFLSRAKTSPLSIHDKGQLANWLSEFETVPKTKTIETADHAGADGHYQRNLPPTPKIFFKTALRLMESLPTRRQRDFVRLVLLSVGQWALDCKSEIPTWSEIRAHFCQQLRHMIEDHYDYLGRVAKINHLPRCRLTRLRRVINRSSEYSEGDRRFPRAWLPAKLVLTSPPYPGVHVVYHRWQINGRRETPAPFWLANGRDGAGEKYYCLGRRDELELRTYFRRLGETFSSVRHLVSPNSVVAQLVAFSAPEWQLPAYLQKMEEAGFVELHPECDRQYLYDGRIWRDVPGRKWYATRNGKTASSHEVLLFHKPAPKLSAHHFHQSDQG